MPEAKISLPTNSNPKKKSTLTYWILLSILVGVITGGVFNDHAKVVRDEHGIVIKPAATSAKTPVAVSSLKHYTLATADFFADIFKRLLKMIIVPLVFTSIITGIISVGSGSNLRRMGLKTLAYYLSTSLAAILTGLLLVNLIQPGVGAEKVIENPLQKLPAADGNLIDILKRMIPTNIVQAAAEGQMLPIIFFAILVGYFITRLAPKRRETFENLASGGFDIMMKITQFVLLFAPLGIWGFLTLQVQKAGYDFFVLLSMYALCVLAGLLVHAFITLPLAVFVIAKRSPWQFSRHMSTALLTAFSTASSSATLPVTLECIEDNAKVSNRVSSFVLPLGATINMDGTALYECVAVMFIAQISGYDFGLAVQIKIVITALLASIGAAGIPMAGLVMMTVVLSAVGLPPEGALLVLAIDRPLDMCRTTLNVWSDSCGALIIASTEGAIAESSPS